MPTNFMVRLTPAERTRAYTTLVANLGEAREFGPERRPGRCYRTHETTLMSTVRGDGPHPRGYTAAVPREWLEEIAVVLDRAGELALAARFRDTTKWREVPW